MQAQLERLREWAQRHRKLWPYALVILLPAILYFRWINFHIFSYGDWNFRYVQDLRSYLSPSAWTTDNGLGTFNDTVWRAPFDFLFGIFAGFDLGMNVAEKFVIVLPLIVTAMLAPYVLLYEIFRDKKAAVLGALFFATNTYFLAINAQGQQLLPLAGNILTLSVAVFLKALRDPRRERFVLSALLLWVAGVVDFRLFYIGAFVMVTLVLYHRFFVAPGTKLPKRSLVLFAGIALFAELSWVVTFALAQSLGSGTTLDNSLFGSQYWNLQSVFTLHHPFWNGVTTTWFAVNQVPFYFWLFPLAAVGGLVVMKSKNKLVPYFAFLALIGIILGKQTSQPFGSLYPFLYAHLPGFNAFREATKFYYLVAVGYAVLITGLLVYIRELYAKQKTLALKRLGLGMAGLLALLCVVNALPYLTGSMQKMFAARTIPNDYKAIANYLSHDNSYYRTLWVPDNSRWSYFTDQHPRLTATDITNLPHGSDQTRQSTAPADQIADALQSPLFEKYLQASSVKYIFVPFRDTPNQDDIFKQYGDDRQFFISELNSLPFLQRVNLGTKDVVAYENKDINPYIGSSSQLFSITHAQNIDPVYQFINQNIAKKPDFTIAASDPHFTGPTASTNEVFDTATAKSVKSDSLATSVTLPAKSTLYVNTNQPHISYQITGATLTLQATYENTPLVNGQPATSSASATTTLSTTSLNQGEQYYISMNGELLPVANDSAVHNLGLATSTPKVITVGTPNLIQNGSFEKGLWQKQVQDCDDYDNSPSISMDLDTTQHSAGKQSLKLMAGTHIACTNSPAMAVTPGAQYVLSFDYLAPYGDRISYGVSFDGKAPQVFSKQLSSGSLQWRTLRTTITVPAGAHTMSLQLRGLPTTSYNYTNTIMVTNFDNVIVNQVAASAAAQLSTAPSYTAVPLPTGKITVSSNDPSITGSNLIPDGSFEKGLWQKQVDDCDPTGDQVASISMAASSDASAGKHSLELSARTHVACTGPDPITINGNSGYLLSFDYKSPNSKTASYSVSFNDADRTVLAGNLTALGGWQNFSRMIRVPAGATTMIVKVYARSDASGAMVTDLYDNFQLFAVPDVEDQAYIVTPATDTTQPGAITFTNTSETSKNVQVHAAHGPFYLTMAEQFDKGWQAALVNGRAAVASSSHVEINGYMNAWYIDPSKLCSAANTCTKNADGSYNMALVIRYTPQHSFRLASVISGIVIAASMGYLVWLYRARIRKHQKNGERK